ncbi:MAG TPA: Gfo/Idh/MocA family oxidoreductase, partial [Armatimonadota bacterium]|nr:Gfo/Idh/MocA family oxidoreductase [Armatimonadota bacterium]
VAAMLDSGITAVLIETPPHCHVPDAIAALQRGIHVLSDVPAVHDIAEAVPLWEAAQRSTATYGFGATSNFWADIDACADLIARDLIGTPYYCEAEYVADLASVGFLPAGSWRQHYAPIRYCTHSLGPILKWVDADLRAVSCFDTGSHVTADPENHDAMVALFRTAGHVVVKLLISFVTTHPTPYHRFLCHATKGYFEHTQPLEGGEQQVLCSSTAVYGVNGLCRLPITHTRPELAEHATFGQHGTADYAMLANFVAAVQQDAPVAVTLRDALRMTLPGLYALESARNGGALTPIAYPWD